MNIERLTTKRLNWKYILTDQQWELCQKFSAEQLKTSYEWYYKRGAPNSSKVYWDIAYGKAAEIAVYYCCREELMWGIAPSIPNCKPLNSLSLSSLSKPDFNSYPPQRKSYAPDLQTDDLNIHVKCTTNTINPSWLFSKTDDVLLFASQSAASDNEDHTNIAFFCTARNDLLIGQPIIEPLYLLNLDTFNDWMKPYKKAQQKSKLAIYAHQFRDY